MGKNQVAVSCVHHKYLEQLQEVTEANSSQNQKVGLLTVSSASTGSCLAARRCSHRMLQMTSARILLHGAKQPGEARSGR